MLATTAPLTVNACFGNIHYLHPLKTLFDGLEPGISKAVNQPPDQPPDQPLRTTK